MNSTLQSQNRGNPETSYHGDKSKIEQAKVFYLMHFLLSQHISFIIYCTFTQLNSTQLTPIPTNWVNQNNII